jgi:hypothetical protein
MRDLVYLPAPLEVVGHCDSGSEHEIESSFLDTDSVPLGGIREVIWVVRGSKPDIVREQDFP